MLRSLLAVLLFLAAVMTTQAPVCADEDLPDGPIHDRHELMEVIGAHSRQIGAAMKQGDRKAIAEAVQQIEVAAAKLVDLFPEGSTHRNSRALPAIWANWDDFERLVEELSERAQNVAHVAREDGDLGYELRQLFDVCKTCHEAYRTPQK